MIASPDPDGLFSFRLFYSILVLKMSSDWKELEHLVRFIEQSITPGSTVEHNKYLPVIGSPTKRTRQCDVIIRTGKPPRETITIVEVQDRTSKTSIGEFGGWLTKLKEVGAQHLICVSRHDFPESIKEGANAAGNTVRLITLKEMPIENVPINILFTNAVFKLKDVHISCGVSEAEVEGLGIKEAVEAELIGAHPMASDKKCWSADKNSFLSMNDICRDLINPKDEGEGEGKFSTKLKEGPELYLYIENNFVRVGVKCSFSWAYEVMDFPVTVLSYEQNEDGILAWAAELRKDDISVKFPIIEDNGKYRIDGLLVNAPEGTKFTFQVLEKDDKRLQQ